jgi:hypothetical protein
MTVSTLCPCGLRSSPCVYPACVEGERTAAFQRAWLPDLYPPVEPAEGENGPLRVIRQDCGAPNQTASPRKAA